MADFTKLNGYTVKDPYAVHTYDSVADLKADTKLKAGNHVETKGYTTAGDGGQGTYIIVEDNTLVDDGGSIHELSNGLFAVLLIADYVTPEMFGAKGDGVTDDYTAIQNCFDYAKDQSLKVEFIPHTYCVSDTLKTYANCIYRGNNATIKGIANKPTMANAKYFDETISGYHTTITDFIIEGDITNSNNDGLILCGWQQLIDNIVIRNVGGHGLVVTSFTNSGSEIDSATLVEGRINNVKCNITGSGKYPFYQHCSNVHITDWRLTNCMFGSPECTEFMHFDRVAGWFIDNVQCYGKATEHGIYSKFASGTHMNNITVDGIMNYGVGIVNQIGSAEINNLHINIHSDVTTSNEIDLIHQTGGSSNTYPLQVTNVNARILGSDTPTNLYIHRGSGYIFDICNVVVTKGYNEVAYKTYYNRGANDIFRINGFEITTQDINFGNIATYASHLSTYKYADTSTTITLTINPKESLRTNGILTIGGEVNGLERGASVYMISLGQRGTAQPVTLINENSSYQFTNVSVTRDASSDTYTITATTPTTSNCNYFMNVIY